MLVEFCKETINEVIKYNCSKIIAEIVIIRFYYSQVDRYTIIDN